LESKPIIRLIPARGEVLAPRDFAGRFANLLSESEQAFLQTSKGLLGDEAEIPPPLRAPLIAAEQMREAKPDGIVTLTSGARSAIWEKQRIQFKGCRPVGGATFPFESIPWGGDQIVRTRIPFGVMTAEAVQRELLGCCFCKARQIPYAVTPICVYAYSGGTRSGQFCLVMRVPEGRRVESFLRMNSMPVSELVSTACADDARLVGSEVTLEGLNSRWYADQKARWLAELHSAGGFRGVLNSNMGNDVIQTLPDVQRRLLLCDFDSFKLVEMPAAPSGDFLEALALQCVVEVVKGSLPILHYVPVPLASSEVETARQVGAAYRQRSSLWNAYVQRARLKAHELSWTWPDLEAAFARAFETSAFLEASCSVILSDYALRRHQQRQPQPYVPH
jgi:hypothetical protein